MRRFAGLIYEIRLGIAEYLLGLAMSAAPTGEEQETMARGIYCYLRETMSRYGLARE